MDSFELGEMIGKAIKPIIILALGAWVGYRYMKKKEKKQKEEKEELEEAIK